MDVASVIDVQHCYYQIEVKILVVTPEISTEETFKFYVYKDTSFSDRLKLSLINVRDEEDSYTCLLNRTKFNAIKESQDLVIDYGDLITHLEILLKPPTDACKLKLKIADDIKLIFYTSSQLKLLTLLEIPFLHTSTREIANNYKAQIAALKKEISTLKGSVSGIEDEKHQLLLKMADKDKVIELSDEYQDKFNELVPRLNILEKENNELRQKLESAALEQFRVLAKLEASRELNVRQENEISKLKKTVEALKTGTNYYIGKMEDLKQMVKEHENELKNSVPAPKYDDLAIRFSHMTADLVSKNALLEEMETLSRQQKMNNDVLIEQLNVCKETISSLQAQNASGEEKVEVEDLDDENNADADEDENNADADEINADADEENAAAAEGNAPVDDDDYFLAGNFNFVDANGTPVEELVIPCISIAELIKKLEKKD